MIALLFSIAKAAEQSNDTTQNAPTPTAGYLGMFGQLLPFILIAVIFYFFIIRPQSKQRQALAQMIKNLKIGDKIATKGGIIGIVSQINETTFIIQLHDGTKMEILKQAVISMMGGEQE
jgi:preprotein translocase subunit YajC